MTGARQTGVPLEEPKNRCELDTEMREPDHLIVVGVALVADQGDAQGNGFGIVGRGLRSLTAA